MAPGFVDCHSHVLPSGDDGAKTIDDALALCTDAARHGTCTLFATPHVWPELTLTDDRERSIRQAHAALEARAALDLRLGFELTPTKALLGEDPTRYALQGTDCVLMEALFHSSLDIVFRLAEHVEAHGLRPVIAHPERAEAVLDAPEIAVALAERGWLLQVNATSITGYHGPAMEAAAWRLLDGEHVAIVASDGHRSTRPARVDAAYAAVRARLGPEAAGRLFDGSALGIVVNLADTVTPVSAFR